MPASPVSVEQQSNDPARRFALWAAARLGLEVGHDGQGRFWLELPLEAREQFDGAGRAHFTFDRDLYARSEAPELELAAPGSRLISWLIERVRELGNVAHGAPADQPTSVHEISGRLFSAYQLDGGSAHLAGCTLEDRLVLRFTWRLRLEGLQPRDELVDVYLDDDGSELSESLRDELGVGSLVPLERPPRVTPGQVEWLVETAQQAAEVRRQQALTRAADELSPRRLQEQRQLTDYFSKTRADVAKPLSESDLSSQERTSVQEQLAALDAQLQRRLAGLEERYAVQADMELVATTLIWCKRAAGKLRFRFGQHSADLAFNDWARTLKPPPYVCPHTGAASRHLAITDDDRICAAEEIEACAETARRVLRKDLLQCQVTGRRVLPQFISICPVTGEQVLTESLLQCAECRQLVSPHALQGSRCQACQSRERIKASDARLVRVFAEHPRLERWGNWSLAETRAVYNLTAAGVFKRLLVVLDKQTLALVYAATGTRFSSTWTPAPENQFEQALA